MGRKSTADLTEDIENAKGVELHGKSLRVNFTYRKTRCRETLSIPVTAKNIQYAKDLVSTIRHQIKTKTFNYADHFPDSPYCARFGSVKHNIKFAEVLDKWFDSKLEISSETGRNYTTVLNCAKDILGSREAHSLNAGDIEEFRNHLFAQLSANTANFRLTVFGAALEYAHKHNYTSENLTGECVKFKETPTTPDPFSTEEYQTLLDKGFTTEQQKNWFIIAVWTGLRTGELCSLAVEDIDLKNQTATIRRNVTRDHEFKLPKNNKERKIALLEVVLLVAQD